MAARVAGLDLPDVILDGEDIRHPRLLEAAILGLRTPGRNESRAILGV
jgi:hypothetical protein